MVETADSRDLYINLYSEEHQKQIRLSSFESQKKHQLNSMESLKIVFPLNISGNN